MSESQVEKVRVANGLTRAAAASAITAHERIELLLSNKSRLKSLGDPRKIRKAIRAEMIAGAIRLAIAEETLQTTALYGTAMRTEYERRCRELGLEAFPAPAELEIE